jgi:hypothetical protein
VSHVGLKTKRIIHAIKCDEGEKYDRYFAIAYLPRTDKYDDCVAVGSLEISKDLDGKEFFNPAKFYDPERMEDAIAHMIAALAAFRAARHGLEPYQAFSRTFNRIESLRTYIPALVEKYYRAMRAASG